MKNLTRRFAFGACVCLIVSCQVVFNFQSKAAPPAQAQSAQIKTQRADASPVALPESSPKEVFYRSTMLLIAVLARCISGFRRTRKSGTFE